MSGKSTTPDLQNVLEGNLANMFMKLLDWFLIKGEREREGERKRERELLEYKIPNICMKH